MMIKDLVNYKKYLDYTTAKLNKFFEREKPYICCKKGCAKCCKNAVFPYSFIETLYLLQGYELLDDNMKKIIKDNIKKVLEQKTDRDNIKFEYDCPFLIDDVCSVYEYRGVICRSFGLISFDDVNESKSKVPFCCFEGLNYSCIYDEKTGKFSEEKLKELGYDEPIGYNVKYSFLTNDKFEEVFDFKFGDKKPLIDWFYDFNL